MFRLNLPGWGKNYTDGTGQQYDHFSQEETPVAPEGNDLQDQFVERVLDIANAMADDRGLGPGQEVVVHLGDIPVSPEETPPTPTELVDGLAMRSSMKGLMHVPTPNEESVRLQLLDRNQSAET